MSAIADTPIRAVSYRLPRCAPDLLAPSPVSTLTKRAPATLKPRTASLADAQMALTHSRITPLLPWFAEPQTAQSP